MFFVDDDKEKNNMKNLVEQMNCFTEMNRLNVPRLYVEKTGYPKVIESLGIIACIMEQRIQEEHRKPYVTDDVERTFIEFACKCMRYILEEYRKETQFRECVHQLFEHRHYGYAFFVNIDEAWSIYLTGEEKNLEVEEKVKLFERYENIYKAAYLAMAEFYTLYFGGFANNETAIKLLCKYFIDISYDEKEQDRIIDGLTDHVKHAGDYHDFGYAFNGLEMLKQYINNLSEPFLYKLLKQYSNGDVEGNVTYRKQIFTILSHSILKDKIQQYKFLYLDSVLLIEMVRDIYNEERKNRGESYINFYRLREMPINQEFVSVEDNEGKPFELYVDNSRGARGFRRLDGDVLFEVFTEEESLNGQSVSVIYQGRKHVLENQPNDMVSVFNKQFFLELKEKLINSKENNYISYKMVYLDKYHGMKQQTFCFDKRFGYEPGRITYDETAKVELPFAYSSKINSIHVIVGKNGTGKTSIVNFLGNDFVNIMFDLEEKGTCVSDVILKYENMKEAEFLVVFEMDGQLYYLSNIKIELLPKNVKPYESSKAGSVKRALSKVFYFSNKVDIMDIFEPQKRDKKGKEKEELQRNLEIWGTKNYSEQRALCQQISRQVDEVRTSYSVKEQEEEKIFNKELFYQLLFLRDHYEATKKKPESMLWEEFSVTNVTLGDEAQDRIMRTFISGELPDGWQNIFWEKRFLQYFSSGQYAKFNFLAKLYWIVKGYSHNTEIIEALGGQKIFYGNEVIEEEDSAILFIDEGDLYYHPEWQRQYVSDLCRVIEEESVKYKLQIIIATNSPFILSDIYADNIIFLSKEVEEAKVHDIRQTFGQNIHTLLKKDFFMRYTIGEFAREKMVQVFRILESELYTNRVELAVKVTEILKKDVSSELVYEYLYHFANSIGENVYRKHMLGLIENHMKNDLNVRINYLKMRQKEIEEELQTLEKEEKHDYDKNEEV